MLFHLGFVEVIYKLAVGNLHVKVSSEGSFQPISWQVLTTKSKQPTYINI